MLTTATNGLGCVVGPWLGRDWSCGTAESCNFLMEDGILAHLLDPRSNESTAKAGGTAFRDPKVIPLVAIAIYEVVAPL